jgi:hypothetical protein
MNYPADVRSIFQRLADSRSIFCSECTHSAFLHRDQHPRLCLFSECRCAGWQEPGDNHEPITEIASEG